MRPPTRVKFARLRASFNALLCPAKKAGFDSLVIQEHESVPVFCFGGEGFGLQTSRLFGKEGTVLSAFGEGKSEEQGVAVVQENEQNTFCEI